MLPVLLSSARLLFCHALTFWFACIARPLSSSRLLWRLRSLSFSLATPPFWNHRTHGCGICRVHSGSDDASNICCYNNGTTALTVNPKAVSNDGILRISFIQISHLIAECMFASSYCHSYVLCVLLTSGCDLCIFWISCASHHSAWISWDFARVGIAFCGDHRAPIHVAT